MNLILLAALSLLPLPREVAETGGFYAPSGEPKVVAAADAALPREGYTLEVGKEGVRIGFADAAGRFYAEKTLAQLKGADGRYPCVKIRDWPAFSFRSVLVDDARLCYGKEGLKKIIDQMAEVKLNILHWHFIEPGAWRMEVPGYPKLAEKLPRDKRYSREDMREMIAYAAARHVRVVPEIEMPGHNSVTRQYPELGHGDDAKPFGAVCPANPKTLAFFKAALDEACAVFTDPVVHFGGDEVSYRDWKKCPRCQAKMKELGLETEADLQAWFMGEMAAHLKAHGKTPVGWSDMLLTLNEGHMKKNAKGYWTGYGIRRTLSKDIVINAWYGDWECAGGCGAVAANLGYKVVQYPSNHCYFDFPQGVAGDPYTYNYPNDLTLETAYDWDPCADVEPEKRGNVIGVGCANWSEKATDLAALEWKLWPRGFATAEIAWTHPEKRDVADFSRRAAVLAKAFRARGVNAVSEGL